VDQTYLHFWAKQNAYILNVIYPVSIGFCLILIGLAGLFFYTFRQDFTVGPLLPPVIAAVKPIPSIQPPSAHAKNPCHVSSVPGAPSAPIWLTTLA